MNDWAIIAILIIVFLLAMFVLPQFMIARTIPKVIKVFREHHALNAKSAKFVDELGRVWRAYVYNKQSIIIICNISQISFYSDTI